MGTIDITPDREGMLRFARQVFAESEPGSKGAEVARKILAEYGQEAFEVGQPVYVTVTRPDQDSPTTHAGVIRKNGNRTALVQLEDVAGPPVSVLYDKITSRSVMEALATRIIGVVDGFEIRAELYPDDGITPPLRDDQHERTEK